MTLMSLASMAGFFEFTDHQQISFGRQSILPTQTVLASESEFNDETNPITREKDEVASEYISFAEVQRTAPRASKY